MPVAVPAPCPAGPRALKIGRAPPLIVPRPLANAAPNADAKRRRPQATTPLPGSLRRCLMFGLGTQMSYATPNLAFTTPDGRIKGVLQTTGAPFTQWAADMLELLEAIAPCGPFQYLPPRCLWHGTHLGPVLEPVINLPEPWRIQLANAGPETHACVRAASWQALHQGDDAFETYQFSVSVSVGVFFGAALFAHLLG